MLSSQRGDYPDFNKLMGDVYEALDLPRDDRVIAMSLESQDPDAIQLVFTDRQPGNPVKVTVSISRAQAVKYIWKKVGKELFDKCCESSTAEPEPEEKHDG